MFTGLLRDIMQELKPQSNINDSQISLEKKINHTTGFNLSSTQDQATKQSSDY